MKRLLSCLAISSVVGWTIPFGVEAQESGPKGKAAVRQQFQLEELLRKAQEEPGPWLPFLDVPTLSMGIYLLAKDGMDQQRPHSQDEVYCVVSGKAMLRVGDEDQPVTAGSIVYVAAGADHRFHSIEEDLQLVVFFSAAKPPNPPTPKGSLRRNGGE